MEKRYRIYTSKKEKIVVLVGIFVLLALVFLFMLKEQTYYQFIFFILYAVSLLFLPKEYRLTADDTLEVYHWFGRAFKPVSLQQITSCKLEKRPKNTVSVVYFRDKLRGVRALRLSDADLRDFLSEVKRRNPAIEVVE